MARKQSSIRSSNGSGSIRKTTYEKNGKQYTYWQARYTTGYDPGTGKQIQHTVTGKTQKEVSQKLRKLTAEIDEGIYIDPCRMTFGEWLDTWTEAYLCNVKPRTIEIYSQVVRTHIKPALGAIRLDELETRMIQTFYNDLLRKKKLAPKYIKSIHGILHRSLEQAIALDYLRINPADKCVTPRSDKKELTPLDDHDMSAFLQQIKGDPLENLLFVTLFTGMREGEILGLKWDCVDFQHGTISVNRQIQRYRENGGGTYRLSSTKSGKGRIITPASSVMDVLLRQKAQQAVQKQIAGSSWEDDNFVFTDGLGHHLGNHIVYRHFKRAATAIGRPDARFHDMRHSYAVASIRSGDDIKTVQGNLGHATASFTLDVYGHVTDQMRRESANRMERYYQSLVSSQVQANA